MLPTHIEQSPPPYNPLGGSPTRMRGRPSTARPHTSRQPSCCSAMLLQLIRCFRSHEQEYLGPSRQQQPPLDTPAAQYQAPALTPSPRAASTSSCDDDDGGAEGERGTLLPKLVTPDPVGRPGASTSAGGATLDASAADALDAEQPRHRRTGSGGSRSCKAATGAETRRSRAAVAAAAVAARAAAAAGNAPLVGKQQLQHVVSQQELAAIIELLGPDADDDDFCPTCLEAYTDDDPRIFTRCGHAFHMQCIYAWLERKATCPLCESPMDLQDDVLL